MQTDFFTFLKPKLLPKLHRQKISFIDQNRNRFAFKSNKSTQNQKRNKADQSVFNF